MIAFYSIYPSFSLTTAWSVQFWILGIVHNFVSIKRLLINFLEQSYLNLSKQCKLFVKHHFVYRFCMLLWLILHCLKSKIWCENWVGNDCVSVKVFRRDLDNVPNWIYSNRNQFIFASNLTPLVVPSAPHWIKRIIYWMVIKHIAQEQIL